MNHPQQTALAFDAHDHDDTVGISATSPAPALDRSDTPHRPDHSRQPDVPTRGAPTRARRTHPCRKHTLAAFPRGTAAAVGDEPADPSSAPLLLTIPEAGRLLGLGRSTMYELTGAGEVEVVHIGHAGLQQRERRAAGERWRDLDLVFPTNVATPMSPSNLRRDLARLTVTAGLRRWSPNELRHSAASLLSASGVPLEQIADVLGHTDTRMPMTAAIDITADLRVDQPRPSSSWELLADAADPSRVVPGAMLLVGNEAATAVVRVVAVDDDEQVHFTVLRGSVDKNRHLLGPASA